MTKKDYIALARIIEANTDTVTMYVASIPYSAHTINHTNFMNDLCTMLKSDNPHFDEVKFRKACGC